MTSKNNSHYYVTTVDLRSNTVTFRESIGNDLNMHQFALARCIATGIELLRSNLHVLESSCPDKWRVLQSCNVTKQNDAISCGIIAIVYSLMICSGQKNKYQIPFEHLDLMRVRKLIVKILGDGILPRIGCEITPIRPDRYGFTAVYKNRICQCLLPVEGTDGSSSLATHPHVTVCQFVTLADKNKKCLGLALKEPYLCSHCRGHNQHRKVNICKHCDDHYIPKTAGLHHHGTTVIDIFSHRSGILTLQDPAEAMIPEQRHRLFSFVTESSTNKQIWLPAQYLRIVGTVPGEGTVPEGTVPGEGTVLEEGTVPERTVPEQRKDNTGMAVESEGTVREKSRRVSAYISAASFVGQRYVNQHFKIGEICEKGKVQRVRTPVDMNKDENRQLVLQSRVISGNSVQSGNKTQQVAGIVNDHPSNTCWFNVLIQSICWNDDVALAAWTHLSTFATAGVKEEVNIN
jgi:hypothetical protein